ncbi:hypothetical protein HZB03_00755 [Candidatus Woesearchaeota archaeon]|nr:hypothetical protein [Candidatus Woesearchaeota archaeon]
MNPTRNEPLSNESKGPLTLEKTLQDLVLGAVVGAAFDLVVPYDDQETLKNTFWDGLYVAMPFWAMAKRYEGLKGGLRASAAGYVGSVAGQTLMNVIKLYL